MKLFCYKYVFQDVDLEKQKRLGIKIVTGTKEELLAFEQTVLACEDVLFCCKEYQHEIDLDEFDKVKSVKDIKNSFKEIEKEKKEVKEGETIAE